MRILASSYTENVTTGLSGSGKGISLFELDESNGVLHEISSYPSINPGFLALNREKELVYTFEERESHLNPRLLTFRIDGDRIVPVHEVPIPGGLPCHLSFIREKGLLAVACYQTGNLHIYNVDENGLPFTLAQTVQHEGKSINISRQEGPHAHMVSYFENEIYVPDLGLDKVIVYSIKNGGLQHNYHIDLPPGGGPRHIAFHQSGRYAFVTNEMSGNISILRKGGSEFVFLKNFYLLSNQAKNDASLSTIHLSGDQLLVGIRSLHCIASLTFVESTASLQQKENVETFGLTPRDFVITPDQKWLLVGNQDSHSIVVFSLEKGSLIFKSKLEGFHSPCCLKVW
ncbi:MAG: beta-propeller fold lactonase family protein [Bacteroidota bacterium]